jgi:stage III sporulation protein AF
MLNLILEYTKNISIYLIFDAFIGIITPSNKYKKYISLISGLILILMMLAPINKFSQVNIEELKKATEVYYEP